MFTQEDFKNNIKLKTAVWEKATTVQGYDPNVWRKDVAGAWIKWGAYGDRDNELGFGWEIDHLKPVAKEGTDSLSNLRPLQWKNNCSKGDNYRSWTSSVSSDGVKNVYKNQTWEIR